MKEKAAGNRVDILGTHISKTDIQTALSLIGRSIETGEKIQVAFIPVNPLLIARRDKEVRNIYNEAALTLADGVPLVWASKLLGTPLPGRIAGSNLLMELSAMAAQKGYTFFFLGSTPEVCTKLTEVLIRIYEGLKVAGSYSPPFYNKFPPEINEEILKQINRAKPDVLFVGLGAPKQEKWIYNNLAGLDVRAAIGVGAAFEMCSGHIKRAPVWMQKSGLEWFFRFLMEPRRLFKRYFIKAVPFFPLVFLQRVKQAGNQNRPSLNNNNKRERD